jgi:hypothetical protein
MLVNPPEILFCEPVNCRLPAELLGKTLRAKALGYNLGKPDGLRPAPRLKITGLKTGDY